VSPTLPLPLGAAEPIILPHLDRWHAA